MQEKESLPAVLENWVSEPSVADFFEVSRQTVAHWRYLGCPAYRLGRRFWFDLEELMAWVRKTLRRERATTTE